MIHKLPVSELLKIKKKNRKISGSWASPRAPEAKLYLGNCFYKLSHASEEHCKKRNTRKTW